MMDMKQLEETFRNGGFDFRLLKRQGLVALYGKQQAPDKTESYEVVILQIRPQEISPRGREYPEREVLPSSEQWGLYGWSYPDLETAQLRFNNTVKQQNNLTHERTKT